MGNEMKNGVAIKGNNRPANVYLGWENNEFGKDLGGNTKLYMAGRTSFEGVNPVDLSNEENLERIRLFLRRDKLLTELKAILSYLVPYRSDIKLILNANGDSYTNGDSITLGVPDYMRTASEEEIYIALRAILSHESQHIKSSNFKLYSQFIQRVVSFFGEKDKELKEQRFKGVLEHIATSYGNGIEDGRIERIAVYVRPGYLRYYKYFRGVWWQAQPVTKPESQANHLNDFLWSICTIATTGLYPKGFKESYNGSNVHKELERIEARVVHATSSRTAADCLRYCMELIEESADFMIPLIKAMTPEETAQFPQNASPEWQTSDERETFEGGQQQSGNQQQNQQSSNGSSAGGNSQGESSNSGNQEKDSAKKEGKEQGGNTQNQSSPIHFDKETMDKIAKALEEKKKRDAEAKKSSDSKSNGTEKGKESGTGSDKKTDEKGSKEGKSDNSKGLKLAFGSDESGASENNGDKNSQNDAVKVVDQSKESRSGMNLNPSNSWGENEVSVDVSEDVINKMLIDIANGLKEEVQNAIRNDKKTDGILNKTLEKAEQLSKQEVRDLVSKSKVKNSNLDIRRHNSSLSHLPAEIKLKSKKFKKDVAEIFKNKESMTRYNLKSGLPNPNDLYRLTIGANDIMMKAGHKSKSDYVAYFLRDESSSMNGLKDKDSAYALSIAEEGLKNVIPLKIVGFRTGAGTSIIHTVIKDFDECKKENYMYSHLLTCPCGGGNADGVAIRLATAELLKRPEKDKILFVFSDGAPSAYKSPELGIADVREAIKEARKQGIIVICIMFGSKVDRERLAPNYKEMYGNNIISCESNLIDKQLTKTLRKLLVY